jgi:hypothetical protein
MIDEQSPMPTAPQQLEPAAAYKGIAVGLWGTCTIVILLSLVPGIGFALGNLPGDIQAGAIGNRVDLPLMTAVLLVIVVSGMCRIIVSQFHR